MKKIFTFIFLTLLFSFLLFFIESYFFGGDKLVEQEERYILNEKSVLDKDEEIEKLNVAEVKKEEKLDIKYFPDNFEGQCRDYAEIYDSFFNSDDIQGKKKNLKIQLYENMIDIRGKMKDKTLKLFGVLKMDKGEFLSVSIHEFGHFVDLYFLEKTVLKDLSYYFYDISWDSTKVIKSGQTQSDFVSGYSMTNKYEDFAESFTYYILHNSDFLEKSKKSYILKKKYDFFEKYLFINEEFAKTDFSKEPQIKDYYRDITKINFSLENFLQYLKK